MTEYTLEVMISSEYIILKVYCSASDWRTDQLEQMSYFDTSYGLLVPLMGQHSADCLTTPFGFLTSPADKLEQITYNR